MLSDIPDLVKANLSLDDNSTKYSLASRKMQTWKLLCLS